LFFKKKKAIDIELPDDGQDYRGAFRIKPDPTRPIILTLAGNSYPVENISGSGCRFRSFNFPEGYKASGTLKIPSDDIVFPVAVEVVSKQRDMCRCRFVRLSSRAENAIHAYVLDVQKSMIRNH
jgi:hypothetical protein